MSTPFKRIELVANVAIIIVAVLLASVLVKNYLWGKTPASPGAGAQEIQPGSKVDLPGVDWHANGRTLVLALSTQCHFCTESAPFYQQLAEARAKQGNLKLVAVFPQEVAEGQKYISNLGVTVDSVKQTQLDHLGVKGTPTLILADQTGAVTGSWRGKLPTDKQSELLNQLK